MKPQFTKNIAINIDSAFNNKISDFYCSLGLETKKLTLDFTILGPSHYSCYVVSWNPRPKSRGEVCLQFETDDLLEVKRRVKSGEGIIEYYGPDENDPDKLHL